MYRKPGKCIHDALCYTCYVTYCVEKMQDYTIDLCVCSFHVYLDIWEATEGEVAKL